MIPRSLVAMLVVLGAAPTAMATDAPPPAKAKARALDRLELDSTAITATASCPK